jgi:hypothetical protein
MNYLTGMPKYLPVEEGSAYSVVRRLTDRKAREFVAEELSRRTKHAPFRPGKAIADFIANESRKKK